MEAQEEILARVLTYDPGETYLRELLDVVCGERRRPQRKAPPREPGPPTRPREGRAAGERAPDRAPSPPPSPEPVTVPADARPARSERERPSEGTRTGGQRETDAEPGPARPRAGVWIAISLVVIAASVAVVVGVRVLPRMAPPAPAPAGAPDAGTTAAPPSPDRGDDELTTFERAARASSDAERAGTPDAYDDAAEAWVRALPALRGDVAEEAAGRQELMEARYRAWSLAPSVRRRDAAMDAVRGYLVIAPSDGQRDSAWSWLARLKR